MVNKSKKNIKIERLKVVLNTKKTINYKYYLLLGILVLTSFTFSSSINNDFTNFDDEKYVLENNYLKDLIYCLLVNEVVIKTSQIY